MNRLAYSDALWVNIYLSEEVGSYETMVYLKRVCRGHVMNVASRASSQYGSIEISESDASYVLLTIMTDYLRP
jgi:hypothetical protein